jgi:small-conductance mechanosensitive channel
MITKVGLSKFFKITLIFFVLFLVLLSNTNAQEQGEEQKQNVDKIKIETIAIEDVSVESEKLSKRISQLHSILKPSSEINDVDSLLLTSSSKIVIKRDSLYSKINDLSQRRLKVRMIEWQNYNANFKNYQNTLNDRLADVTEVNKELLNEINKWTFTKEKLSADNKIGDIYSNIDTVINTLNEIVQISLVRLDSIFVVQKKLTNLVLLTDEVISEIKRVQQQMQRDYFVFDSPMLWQINKIDSIATDTTNTTSTNSFKSIKSEFNENMASLKVFFSKNINIAIFQILFLSLIFVLLIVVRKKWDRDLNLHSSQVEKETAVILKHPFAATIIVGLLFSAFFYKSLIPTAAEIHIIIILAATIFLLPRLTTKRFNIFLTFLLIEYIITVMQAYLFSQSFLYRIILLLNTIAIIVGLIYGQIEVIKKPKSFLHLKGLFKLMIPVYVLFLVVAIIANIIGMAHLSNFLVKGTLSSTILGIVIYLSVKISTSIFVLLIQVINSYNTHAFSAMVKVVQKRLKPILYFVGLLMWFYFTLKGFELFEYLLQNVTEILLIKWKVGNMTISVGGVLSFTTIFIVAILLAKLAAAIFQDEWLINVLPRGAAPAISLMLRIFIIALGFYASLSASGVPINQLGFIVGALGVGIGFGLQNIVANFIAGLILAFERPINLGDTIEVDMEMGVVTNIGARSSNIKTYSGSEAIIPNGDLISKKVVNWTLTNRDRRSNILMKTSGSADPEKVIELFNRIASENPKIFKNPEPTTHFYGFTLEGNLDFSLFYWTTFNDAWSTKADVALKLFAELKKEGIQAPLPAWRNISTE